jgi:tripartite-type tricarboxylate transporter receptor subunit TctC
MQPRLGQSVIIENRPGGGLSIGAKAVATADPDGYTLLSLNNGHYFGLTPNAGYDPVTSLRQSQRLRSGAMFLSCDRAFRQRPSKS